MTYYVQVAENGRILRSLDHDGEPLPAEAFKEVAALFVFAPPFDGAVPYWTPQGTEWRDDRTLEQVRAQQWAQIKAERAAREFGGMVWDGSPFDTDEVSQRRIQGAVQLAVIAQAAQQPFSIGWTLADDSVRTLDGADMIAVGMALAQHVGSLHETGRLLRQQIDEAATVADVIAVSWPQE